MVFELLPPKYLYYSDPPNTLSAVVYFWLNASPSMCGHLLWMVPFMRWKQVVDSLVSLYFNSSTWYTIKTNCIKYWDMLNLDISENVQKTFSPPELVHDFSWFFICLLLYSVNLPNLIAGFPLLLEILGNMSGCGAINFETKLIFLFKPFLYMTKNEDKNLNIFQTKRNFKLKQKAFFIFFKGFPVAKNCFRPENGPFITEKR